MNTYISTSAKKHQLILWVISLLFYVFLVSFGSTLMSDLPKAYKPDPKASEQSNLEQSERYRELVSVEQEIETRKEPYRRELLQKHDNLDQATLALKKLKEEQRSLLESRKASQDESYNEKIKSLEQAISTQLAEVEKRQNEVRLVQQEIQRIEQDFATQMAELAKIRQEFNRIDSSASQAYELKSFLVRLALLLPLLLAAGYAFKRYRKSDMWPFVYGFGAAALTFFLIELVPYVPSFGYGKYVYSLCAIGLTVFAGMKTIKALNEYLARQRELEKTSSAQRKEILSKEGNYDASVKKLKAGNCPSCEKPIADFIKAHEGKSLHCPHCGFGIKTKCRSCGEIKNSLTKFCTHCGAADTTAQEAQS